MWQMEKVKQSLKGSKTYSYWMASWREGDRTRNVKCGVDKLNLYLDIYYYSSEISTLAWNWMR